MSSSTWHLSSAHIFLLTVGRHSPSNGSSYGFQARVNRRFATAYNAALQAANMAIACAGYRIVSKVGHHRVSLESTKLVLGKPGHKYADYFEICRRKRNTIDFTRHGDIVGYYVPARRKRSETERATLKVAAAYLQQALAAQGISAEGILKDFKRWRRGRRK
jgi:hypothetical protein